MKLSIIIPTFNRRRVLEDTLPSVFDQTVSSDSFEVLIVVDGSTDGTAAAMRRLDPECGLNVIEQPNRGPAAARNVGLRAAQGDLVLFLDDDIRCDSRLVEEHLQGHSGNDHALVHGRIGVDPVSPSTLAAHSTAEWYERYYNRLANAGGRPVIEDIFLISNSSVARSTVLACGGFDEDIPFPREDFELGLRLWKAGVKFRYRPGARAYEVFSKSSRAFVKDEEAHGRGELAISMKHPDYKPYSALRDVGRGSILKRGLRRALATSPLSPAPLLTLPVFVAERLMGAGPVRRAGTRLLGIQERIALLRGACRGAGGWPPLAAQFGRRLPVLLYHRVGAPSPALRPALTVTRPDFERHVRWLSRLGFEAIRPREWEAWRVRGGSLPKKPVILTFDDGYADLEEFALPMLRNRGTTASVFIVTGEMGGRNSWDELPGGTSSPALMSAEQIRSWAAEGFEFGAHTRTHARLSRDLAGDLLDKEVRGSQTDLEQLLGREVRSFAYPFGDCDDAVRNSLRGVYDAALTTEEGMNDLTTDPLRLRRTMVQPDDSLLDLVSRLYLGFSAWQRFRARAIRLRRRLLGR